MHERLYVMHCSSSLWSFIITVFIIHHLLFTWFCDECHVNSRSVVWPPRYVCGNLCRVIQYACTCYRYLTTTLKIASLHAVFVTRVLEIHHSLPIYHHPHHIDHARTYQPMSSSSYRHEYAIWYSIIHDMKNTRNQWNMLTIKKHINTGDKFIAA